MNAYVYNAALYCEECASEIRCELANDGIGDNGDSEYYPQGPYGDGGGEADCPQHCDSCGLFLENPLTGDGEEYVIAAISDNDGNQSVLKEWRDYYNYLPH